MRGLRLGDSLLLLSAYIAQAGTQAVLLWAFAHAAGPSGAGEFALAFAVSTPVIMGFQLALRYVLQTLDSAPGFRVFFVIRGVCAATGVLLVIAGVAVGLVPLGYSLLLPLLALKFVDSVLDICLAGLQAEGNHRRVAVLIWANAIMSFVAIVATLAVGAQPEWAVAGSAVASAAVLLFLAPGLLMSAPGPWVPRRLELTRVLRSGVALGVAQTLIALWTYVPVFFLAQDAGEAAVGIFAVCQYSVTFANLFYASASQTWVSDLRRAYLQGGREHLVAQSRGVAGYLLGVGAIGGLCTLLLLPTLAPQVFGREFAVDYYTALPFALTVVALSIESTLFVALVVLNRYASRATTAASGVLVTGGLAIATTANASVLVAGYLVFAGVLARCAVSGWNLRTALASEPQPGNDDPTAPLGHASTS